MSRWLRLMFLTVALARIPVSRTLIVRRMNAGLEKVKVFSALSILLSCIEFLLGRKIG
jgi:hypothetical protein